ncbi:MAG: S41 family peptidase [Bacillota bacterium]
MKRAVRGLVAMVLAGALLLAIPGGARAAAPEALLDPIAEIYELLEAYHKDGVDPERFLEGAIRGGLEALGDPYTQYFSPAEWEQHLSDLDGRFAGIGVYLDQAGDYLIVAEPIPGTPAEAAGLQPGDRFLAVDGVSVVGASIEEAQRLIRGEPGTPVQLTMERPGKGPFTVTITRAEIQVPLVSYRMLEGGVGYLSLSQFGDTAPAEVYRAIRALKREGATALVLDLRQNPGGYLDAAVQIAGGWVPAGEPVLVEVTREGEHVYRSPGGLVRLPTAVLVDGGTASAAEILAAAIQEHGGVLVGSRTYGKGTIQTLITLPSGGGITITEGEYLTGQRRKVDGVGLMPDVEVEPPAALELTLPLDLQRDLAPGDVGLDVLAVQERLAFLGYAVPQHGGFDPAMEAAVRAFRQRHGLAAEPRVDAAFTAALEAAVAERMAALAAQDPVLEAAVALLTGAQAAD